MLLPDSAIEIIKMQRSNYGKKKIKREYNVDMENEFNQIISVLGDNCKSILDIGCGLAGVSILLSNYFNNPDLYLVDKNEMPKKPRYGFSDNICFYNSFDVLKEILEMNYINNYHFVDPDDDFKEIRNVDLIVSFLACGFHFPLYFYFGRIFDCLSKDGVFICDIRKSNYDDEIKLVNLYFRNVSEIITDNPKTTRICAKEPVCQA